MLTSPIKSLGSSRALGSIPNPSPLLHNIFFSLLFFSCTGSSPPPIAPRPLHCLRAPANTHPVSLTCVHYQEKEEMTEVTREREQETWIKWRRKKKKNEREKKNKIGKEGRTRNTGLKYELARANLFFRYEVSFLSLLIIHILRWYSRKCRVLFKQMASF